MTRKVFVQVTVSVVINMDEGIEVSEVLNDMDYNFKSNTNGADVVDTELSDFEVYDSK
jgi:hypothetical protein